MDTTAQHIATRDDKDLRERFVASAEQAHIPNPAQFVEMNLGRLISTPIEGTHTTITTVHAYASEIRRQALESVPPEPGKNPAAITDTHLSAAIAAVWGADEPQ